MAIGGTGTGTGTNQTGLGGGGGGGKGGGRRSGSQFGSLDGTGNSNTYSNTSGNDELGNGLPGNIATGSSNKLKIQCLRNCDVKYPENLDAGKVTLPDGSQCEGEITEGVLNGKATCNYASKDR